jgi:pyruvate carboxylase
VPSEAEHCRAQAAEFRRRAEQANDVSTKNELLEIANYWDELRSAYEAFERSKQSD